MRIEKYKHRSFADLADLARAGEITHVREEVLDNSWPVGDRHTFLLDREKIGSCLVYKGHGLPTAYRN